MELLTQLVQNVRALLTPLPTTAEDHIQALLKAWREDQLALYLPRVVGEGARLQVNKQEVALEELIDALSEQRRVKLQGEVTHATSAHARFRWGGTSVNNGKIQHGEIIFALNHTFEISDMVLKVD